jgi:hypothetical protein
MSCISDFPWRQQSDGAGATYYYNVVTNARADTFESIPLPPDWFFDTSEGCYCNVELGEYSDYLPGQLVENKKVKGFPYKLSSTDEDEKMIYRHLRTQEYVKESDIVLPDGWKRGKTYAGVLYYYNEEHEEYSYRLPGEKDRPLHHTSKSAYRDMLYHKGRLDELEYHMFHREVLSRCEHVITHALVKLVGTDAVEFFLPGHDCVFPPEVSWLRLYQLLNLLDSGRMHDPRLIFPPGIDRDALQAMCDIFRSMKSINHAVVHQQILRKEDLNRIMSDIVSGLQDEQDGPQCVPLMNWIYDNHPEYLRTGKRKKLVDSSVEFPWDQFFPHVEGGSESGRELD